jgi:predicted nucleic acid-binding protein
VIVVDTNVIAYLFIAGDQTPLAEKVKLKDPEWASPKLWRSEMRNLLMLYVRRGAATLADVTLIMARAERDLANRECNVDSDRVLHFANVSGCTAYDCEFVAASELLAARLVTTDKQLLKAFPTIAISMSDFLVT